jgi:tubulin polyglutamylase TTLL6/13
MYVDRPLLLSGLKFDLRLYVVVTGLRPLRAYLFRDGLVRVCTEPYAPPSASNLQNRQMHLTNYAVNKSSRKFRSSFSAGYSPEEDQEEQQQV